MSPSLFDVHVADLRVIVECESFERVIDELHYVISIWFLIVGVWSLSCEHFWTSDFASIVVLWALEDRIDCHFNCSAEMAEVIGYVALAAGTKHPHFLSAWVPYSSIRSHCCCFLCWWFSQNPEA